MPHSNRPKAPVPGFKPATFVNIDLDDDVAQKLKSAPWGLTELDATLNKLLADRYKLTVRYDERNDCFAAWIVSPDAGANRGYILAGRGSTPSKAVKQVCYIHFVLLEGDWVEGGAMPRKPLDD